jgi:large subunit ribosomal protein L25
MSNKLTLNVASRAQTGRSSSRRLRKVKRIPAILYGKHTNPELLSVDSPEFVRLLKEVKGRAKLIELTRADKGASALAFLQEVQRDPITDNFLHIDLHEVKADEKFEINVPVRIVGEAYGVKTQGGVLEIASHTLRIRCLPKDLPEAIPADVTDLKTGETLKVGGLKPLPGVEYRTAAGQPIASCLEIEAEVVATTEATGPSAAAGAAATAAGAAAAAAAAPAAKGAAGAKPAAGAAAAPAAGAKAAAPAAAAKAPAKK